MKNKGGTVEKRACREAVRLKGWLWGDEVDREKKNRAGREQTLGKRCESQGNGNPSCKFIKCFSAVTQQAPSRAVPTD